MIKRLLPMAAFGMALLSTTSCKNSNYKSINGVEYKIVQDAKGPTAVVGDMIALNIRLKIGDSTMVNSRIVNNGKPVELPLQAPAYRGDWMSVLTKLSAGDSAVIRVSVDTMKKSINQPLPPFMKSGQYMTYEVSVVSVKTMDEYKKDLDAADAQHKIQDDKLLQDFFVKNKLTPLKTPSGVYYVIQTPGSGNLIKSGDKVSIRYTGKTLDGEVFDSNEDTTQPGRQTPLSFTVGQHQMIPGMDDAMTVLKKGSVATLYIPSVLGYGSRGAGEKIKPYTNLIFDVRVVDVK